MGNKNNPRRVGYRNVIRDNGFDTKVEKSRPITAKEYKDMKKLEAETDWGKEVKKR